MTDSTYTDAVQVPIWIGMGCYALAMGIGIFIFLFFSVVRKSILFTRLTLLLLAIFWMGALLNGAQLFDQGEYTRPSDGMTVISMPYLVYAFMSIPFMVIITAYTDMVRSYGYAAIAQAWAMFFLLWLAAWTGPNVGWLLYGAAAFSCATAFVCLLRGREREDQAANVVLAFLAFFSFVILLNAALAPYLGNVYGNVVDTWIQKMLMILIGIAFSTVLVIRFRRPVGSKLLKTGRLGDMMYGLIHPKQRKQQQQEEEGNAPPEEVEERQALVVETETRTEVIASSMSTAAAVVVPAPQRAEQQQPSAAVSFQRRATYFSAS